MYNFNSLNLLPNYIYREEILTPLVNLLHQYLDNHSKSLVIRFDIRYPHDYPITHDNQHLSETIAYISKKYKRQGLDPKYFWVMEQHQSHHPHYHLVLFLDGQKIRSYSHVFHNVEEAWARALQIESARGLVHHCNIDCNGNVDMNRNGIVIRNCDDEETRQAKLQAVYQQISYLAKEEDKSTVKDGLRNFGMSRIGIH